MKFLTLSLVVFSTIFSFNFHVNGQCASVYVSPTGTALGDGTEANPMDLQTGVAQACALNRKHVRLIAGTYNLTAKIVVGCDDLIIDGDWEIVSGVGRKNSSLATIVNVNSSLQTGAYDGAAGTTVGFYIGIEAITRTNFRIEDITFHVKNGGASGTATGTTGNRGNSVYGFYFRNSNGYILERVEMNVGSGSSGSAGVNGAVSANGGNGANGVGGDCDDDCMINNGGAGGLGASGGGAGGPTVVDASCGGTSAVGDAGNTGSNTANPLAGGGGGSGAGGGSENNPGGRGGNGGSNVSGGGAGGNVNGAGGSGYGSNGCTSSNVDGRAGTPGANGVAGVAGTLVNTSSFNLFWLPSGQSNNGTNGTGGGGGQGGGGGGGQGCFFCIDGTGGAGGGGGGGGQGGLAGTGGWGAGGTFALFSFNSSGVRNNCSINAGPAAAGGVGGTGANGGTGGIGGQGADGNNTSTTTGGVLTNGRVCGGCIETGAGGRGGNGGTGGAGGSGGAGAPGLSSIVEIQSGGSSTPSTVAGITQIITNQPLAGCTNSEILITKDGGTWGLTGTAAFIQDLNAASSSYTTASGTALISYTATGAQSINISGNPYGGFIMVNTNRALPTFDASMSNTICEGNSFLMNTPTSGAQYEWVIFPAAGNSSTPVAIFTTSVASWPTPITGTSVNYTVRLRIRDNCCGWSVPVYYNFSVVSGSIGPIGTGATICENNTATISAVGSGTGNINWYSDALGQIVLQSTPGINSTYVTPILTQNTVFYVGEGLGGCPGSLTSVQVTVNPMPIAPSSSAANVCQGQNVILSANGSGGTLNWYNVPSGGAILGTGTTFNAGALVAGSYTFYVEENNGTCSSSRVAVGVTVNPLPIAPILSGTTVCSGGNASLTATGSGTINWFDDAGLTNLVGTGSVFISPALTANTTYYATQTNVFGCSGPSASALVTVNPNVVPSMAIAASANTICAGTAVNFTSTNANPGTTPVYEWYVNGVAQSNNNATFSSSALANGDVVSAMMTSNSACASPISATSNSVVMTVNPVVTPTIAASASSTSICAGETVSFTAAGTNGGTSPVYQWTLNGAPVGSNSSVYTNSTLASGDQILVSLTSSDACATTATVTSALIVMTVNPNVVPSMAIAASANTICAGTAVNFTSTNANPGTTPVYEWYVNGVAQSNNNSTFSSSALSNGDVVSAMMTSNAACASPISATSNSVVMTVNPVVTPTIAASASSTSICAGETVSFTAAGTNGGTSPVYQWTLNGAPVGSNSSVYTNSTLTSGDQILVSLTSSDACATTATVTSALIVMTVNPNVVPSMAIAASANTICAGTAVNFTSTNSNPGTTPVYEWYVNGVAQSNNNSTFSSTTLANGDVVSAMMTSNAACASPISATSNSVVMTVNPVVTPTIAASASSTSICAGETVTFTAAGTNGGTSPVYQWTLNGAPVGSNSSVYTNSTLASGDQILVSMTSSDACATTATVTSALIVMTANTTVLPFAFISTPQTTICPGDAVAVSSTINNGGLSPVYDWYLNGISTGVTTSNYNSTSLNDGDVLTLVMTSSSACANPATVSSNSITFDHSSSVLANVTIASLSSVLCEGETITFLASPNNAFSNLNYSWDVNGAGVGTNNPIYIGSTLSAGDVVSVELIYDDVCGNSNTVVSNQLTIAANPIVDAGTDITIVQGGSAQINATSSIIGVYDWTPSTTLNDATILDPIATPTTSTEYTITVTTPQGCAASDMIMIKVDDLALGIDNSFTPNDDGINDTWVIHNLELYPELNMQIFNRWGNLLYEQNNTYTPWDGKFKGEPLPSETYYYVLELGNGQEAIKGIVTIVR
jgi:gliding motility-associated-like protein